MGGGRPQERPEPVRSAAGAAERGGGWVRCRLSERHGDRPVPHLERRGVTGKTAEGKPDDVAFIGKVPDDLATVVTVDVKRVAEPRVTDAGPNLVHHDRANRIPLTDDLLDQAVEQVVGWYDAAETLLIA